MARTRSGCGRIDARPKPLSSQTTQLETLTRPDADPKALLAIGGIGKGMAANIRDLVTTGTMPLRDELLTRYKASMLELLRLPGMGPKTVALLYSALGVADVDSLEEAAKRGDLLTLPRMGQKFTEKLLKGIEDYRKNTSRFRIDVAREHAERISELIRQFPGIETITPSGSLRRGRETVGDLDLLVTGPACEPEVVAAAVDHVAALPLIDKLLAKGQNKVSFTLRNHLQVDVRLLPPGQLWRRAAVFHRLQAPQRDTAPAGDQARLHAERVRPAAVGGQPCSGIGNRAGDLQRAGS